MNKTYLLSDPHLGHRNIHLFRKQFATSEEHHEHVFENIAKLDKTDTLILSGDVVFDEEWASRLSQVRCNLKLYLGNHDYSANHLLQFLRRGKAEIHGFESRKGYWLSHCPIHPQEMRNRRGNIHGHTHYAHIVDENGVPDSRYINVCCEYTNYQPITWEYAISNEYYYHRVQMHATEQFQFIINKGKHYESNKCTSSKTTT